MANSSSSIVLPQKLKDETHLSWVARVAAVNLILVRQTRAARRVRVPPYPTTESRIPPSLGRSTLK